MKRNFSLLDKLYQVLIKNSSNSVYTFVRARDRRQAVYKAENWFWSKYRGTLGPAHRVLFVSDHYREVRYGPTFHCHDRINRFLPTSVIKKVITESGGELMIDTRPGKPHHPPGCVRRIKRRRDFGHFIAPNIKQMKCGTMYYRITLVAQRSTRGHEYQKRKHLEVRLLARNLADAIKEIRERKLRERNAIASRRTMKVRSPILTSYVAGLRNLNPLQEERFAQVLLKYETPRCVARL